jgi:plasmid stabilization system protein ParE
MPDAYIVVFERLAGQDLDEIETYIVGKGSPGAAFDFTERIIDACQALRTFPYRGRARDDLAVGLRTIGFEGSTTITYTVDDNPATVTITGVFYDGRDWERHSTQR